jgi:hypothetical protein
VPALQRGARSQPLQNHQDAPRTLVQKRAMLTKQLINNNIKFIKMATLLLKKGVAAILLLAMGLKLKESGDFYFSFQFKSID